MELTDTNRLDPFAPTKTPRRIMVSAIYPVEHTSSTRPSQYMPLLTAEIEDASFAYPAGSYESLFLQVGCTSKPHDDAPLVLFSPAQGTPRLYYSLLVSHVPSYGFTVIMMDHPYDADVVEFPDGSYIREATSNATTIPEIIAMATGEVDVRVQDTSFVLDQLNNKSVIHHLIPGRGCAPDPNSVAMFGHSLGGATAAAAMVNETRIKGGLNLDGAILNCSDVLELGLDRPFLLFGHQNNTRFYNGTTEAADYSAETWSDFWSVLTMETRA